MSNPAQKLLELLDAWDVPKQQTVSKARGREDMTPEEFWTSQIAAVEHLRDVLRILDALEQVGTRVDTYRKYFPVWAAAVFSSQHGFKNQVPNGQRLLADPHRDMLDSLVAYIEVAQLVPDLDGLERNNLRARLEEVRSLIESDASLDKGTRAYLLELVSSCLHVLDELDAQGAYALRDEIMLLGGALDAAGEMYSEGTDQKNKYRNAAASLFRTVMRKTGDKFLDAAVSGTVDGISDATRGILN